MTESKQQEDKLVQHPSHYTDATNGIECTEISSFFSFNIGNVFKYCWRHGKKVYDDLNEFDSTLRDLNKADWYLRAEMTKLKAEAEGRLYKGKDVDKIPHYNEFMDFFVEFMATTFSNEKIRARLHPGMTFSEYLTLVGQCYLNLPEDHVLVGEKRSFPLPTGVAPAQPKPVSKSTYNLITKNGVQMADINLHIEATPDTALAIISLLHHIQVMTQRDDQGKVAIDIRNFDEFKVDLPQGTRPAGPVPRFFKNGETVFDSSTKWAQMDTEGAKPLYGDDVEVQDMAVFHKKPVAATPSQS